jgi:hypothetical protein
VNVNVNRGITVRDVLIVLGVGLGLCLLMGANPLEMINKVFYKRTGAQSPTLQELLKKKNQHGWTSLASEERDIVRQAYVDSLSGLAVACDHAGQAYQYRGNFKAVRELAYHYKKCREAIASIRKMQDDSDPTIFQSLIDQVEGVLR